MNSGEIIGVAFLVLFLAVAALRSHNGQDGRKVPKADGESTTRSQTRPANLRDKPMQTTPDPAQEAAAIDLAREAFEEFTDSARKAYNDATISALRAYTKAARSAVKALDEDTPSAVKASDEAMAAAGKALDEAMAVAQKALDEAMASMEKTAEEFRAAAFIDKPR